MPEHKRRRPRPRLLQPPPPVWSGLIVLAATLTVSSCGPSGRETPESFQELAEAHLAQLEGDSLRLSDFRGKPTLINFWASWCVECYKEADLLEQAWRDYKDRGVMFIGVDHLDTDTEGLDLIPASVALATLDRQSGHFGDDVVEGAASRDDRAAVCPAHEVLGDSLVVRGRVRQREDDRPRGFSRSRPGR